MHWRHICHISSVQALLVKILNCLLSMTLASFMPDYKQCHVLVLIGATLFTSTVDAYIFLFLSYNAKREIRKWSEVHNYYY